MLLPVCAGLQKPEGAEFYKFLAGKFFSDAFAKKLLALSSSLFFLNPGKIGVGLREYLPQLPAGGVYGKLLPNLPDKLPAGSFILLLRTMGKGGIEMGGVIDKIFFAAATQALPKLLLPPLHFRRHNGILPVEFAVAAAGDTGNGWYLQPQRRMEALQKGSVYIAAVILSIFAKAAFFPACIPGAAIDTFGIIGLFLYDALGKATCP